VNDILDLERMRSGKITLQPVKCNIANLLLQATEAMQAMADQAQITLITEPINVELWIDPDRILQTLTNLLNNAIKFSPSGSTVWLRGEIKNEELGMKSAASSPSSVFNSQLPTPHILISVQDQGRGVPSDKINLIFERFQQVDVSDSRQKGGTGLGLAICRNIVEQHGGKIGVESVLEQGSTFYVLLPLERQTDGDS
jgi:signal transduction histidine kinase